MNRLNYPGIPEYGGAGLIGLVADPGYPRCGAPNPKVGAPTLSDQNFPENCMRIDEIISERKCVPDVQPHKNK